VTFVAFSAIETYDVLESVAPFLSDDRRLRRVRITCAGVRYESPSKSNREPGAVTISALMKN
jgi:hypothetical protein